jgi:hypothetical protein
MTFWTVLGRSYADREAALAVYLSVSLLSYLFGV